MPRKGEKKVTSGTTPCVLRTVPFRPVEPPPPPQGEEGGYEIRVGAQPELQRVVKRRLTEMLEMFPETTDGTMVSPLDIGPPAVTAKMARSSTKITSATGSSAFQPVPMPGYSTPPRESDTITIYSAASSSVIEIPYPGLMLHRLCARLLAPREGGEPCMPSPCVSPIPARDPHELREESPSDFLIMRSADRGRDGGRPSSPAEDMLFCDEAFAQMGLECQRLAGLVAPI